MKTISPSWLPDADPEALIKEARRRQRRRRVAIGLALAVILGSVAGPGCHAPRTAPRARRDRPGIRAGAGSRWHHRHLGSRESRRLALSGLISGSIRAPGSAGGSGVPRSLPQA